MMHWLKPVKALVLASAFCIAFAPFAAEGS
jgi:hypothetical protein